jgi:hypothetical protein
LGDPMRFSWFSSLALWSLLAAMAHAAEIGGAVRAAGEGRAEIAVSGDLVPSVGDPAEIYFKIPGGDDEVSVAKGKVAAVAGDSVSVKIEDATGTVAKDQRVRFTSGNPQKKTAAKVPASPAVQPAAPPRPDRPIAPQAAPPVNGPIHFDAEKLGTFAANTFAQRGVRFVAEKGEPLVMAAEANMVVPGDHKQVLLLGGERVTSLAIHFDHPLRRLGLKRIGTRGGASVPTWTLQAFDASGKVIASTGENRGLPQTPQTFSVSGPGIVSVRLQTDNRHGDSTWATWNSLPVAEFEIER